MYGKQELWEAICQTLVTLGFDYDDYTGHEIGDKAQDPTKVRNQIEDFHIKWGHNKPRVCIRVDLEVRRGVHQGNLVWMESVFIQVYDLNT